MNIGQKIRKIRESQELSMNALAKKADVGQSSLSHIENNNRQPTFDILERIITALGFTLAEFFAEESPVPAIPPHLQELLENAQGLTSSQVKTLNEFLKTLKGER